MDSGAEDNCVDLSEAKRLKLMIKPSNQSSKTADGVTMKVLGEVSTTFERSGQTFHFEGLVCAKLTSPILSGIPFIEVNTIVQELHKHRITFERENKKYSILEIPPFCPKPEPSSYIRSLKAERPMILESSMSNPDCSVC